MGSLLDGMDVYKMVSCRMDGVQHIVRFRSQKKPPRRKIDSSKCKENLYKNKD